MSVRNPPVHRPVTKGIRANLSTIALLAGVIFFVFVSRVIYSPMLPAIERDLHLNHTQAASFFLFISLGYVLMNLFSGFIASWLGHKSTILLSVLLVISATAFVAASPSLPLIRLALVLLGVGAGLYPPSGVATATSLVESKDVGKVLSIHEIGPNLGFVLAPLLAAPLLLRFSWRSCLLLLCALGLMIGLLFMILGRGGLFRGEPPRLRNTSRIVSLPSFWIATALMALGAGAGIGLYSIIPAYLVFERGLEAGTVNTLVGVSRISSLAALVFAGFLVDRLGPKRTISAVLLSAGIATSAFWFRSQALLMAAVFIQPILIVSFFPAILTAVSRITERRLQNLTVSFLLPIGYGFGGGLVPLLLGWLGDHASFALGFLLYGLILAAGSLLPYLLKLSRPE